MKNHVSRLTVLIMLFTLNTSLHSQNLQMLLSESWTGSSWQNFFRQTNTYDGNGYLTHNLSELWNNPSTIWVNNSQSNYTNNPNGTANNVIAQSWNTGTSSWNNSGRYTYTYNASNKILTAITESWSSGIWRNFMRQTSTYDASGYLITNLTELWDTTSSIWKNSSKLNYTNNPNGTANQIISQTWNVGSSSWDNSGRITYTYTATNKFLTTLTETWTLGAWQNFFRQTNTYDGSDYLVSYLSEIWDNPSTMWKNQSLANYTNNPNGTPSQLIIQSWNTGTSSWNNSGRYTYTWILSSPDVVTTGATLISSLTASSGGNVTQDGGASVTTRGVCWSTSPNPTTSSNLTVDGTGMGSFTSNISGLTPSTTYYYRAYATNSIGTTYGDEYSFTTSSGSTGINDEENIGLIVYPNPVSNSDLFITSNAIGSRYIIINQLGEVFATGEIVSETIIFPSQQMTNGVYYLTIIEKGVTYRIIKN